VNKIQTVVYDIETCWDIFSLYAECPETGASWLFRLTSYVNDIPKMINWFNTLANKGIFLTGFNNVAFDWPVLDYILRLSLTGEVVTNRKIFDRAQTIIQASNASNNEYYIWPHAQAVKQIDLFRINHFHNKARRTGLKYLEFRLGIDNLQEMPFNFREPMTKAQHEQVILYNINDVRATIEFYNRCQGAIATREKEYFENDLNYFCSDDNKIYSKYLISRLEQNGIQVYDYVDKKKVKRQSHYETIAFKDIIFDYVKLEDEPFKQILQDFKKYVLVGKDIKGVIAKPFTYKGVKGSFGAGGIHASMPEGYIFRSRPDRMIMSVDVSSYYPNLFIKNKLYPAHLGPEFYKVLQSLYNERATYDKQDPMNKKLKLAMNTAFGNSNSESSEFYDLKIFLSITINGQLLLAMLAEWITNATDGQLIFLNTDGLEVMIHPSKYEQFKQACDKWQQVTQLTLEFAEYETLWARDVNNYVGLFKS
jgi:hypothetical protein